MRNFAACRGERTSGVGSVSASDRANWIVVLRRRAGQAEAAAGRTQDEISRSVFLAVAEAWRSIALEAAREEKRLMRSPPHRASGGRP